MAHCYDTHKQRCDKNWWVKVKKVLRNGGCYHAVVELQHKYQQQHYTTFLKTTFIQVKFASSFQTKKPVNFQYGGFSQNHRCVGHIQVKGSLRSCTLCLYQHGIFTVLFANLSVKIMIKTLKKHEEVTPFFIFLQMQCLSC